MKTITFCAAVMLFAAPALLAQQPQTGSQQPKSDPRKAKTENPQTKTDTQQPKTDSEKPKSDSQQTKTGTQKQPTATRGSETSTTQYTYFVQASHQPGQCNQVINDLKAKSENNLPKFYYGCKSGDHTIYGFLRGSSEERVKASLPAIVTDNAKIVRVDKFSPSQTTVSGADKEKGKSTGTDKDKEKGKAAGTEKEKKQEPVKTAEPIKK